MAEEFVKISGLNRLTRRFNSAEQGIFTEQLMGEIATFIITSILNRTRRGVDAEGRFFQPYTPKYRMFREETGHQGSPVNLFYTGSMLSAMTFKSSKTKAEIFFINTSSKDSKITNPQKAFYNQQSRNFFAISLAERDEIREMVEDHIHNVLQG